MISYTQALVLGLIQGLTELFPVSSLGHSIIISGLAGWNTLNNPENILVFLVATHLATALVLIAFFGRQWLAIIGGLVRSIIHRNIETPTERLGWLIIVATIPAGLIGLILQKLLTALFTSSRLVAIVLVMNGIILALVEMYIRKRQNKNARANATEPAKETTLETESEQASAERLSTMSIGQAFLVGLSQVLALIPGFSRTGMTMSGGIFAGLNREDALRFSFLLSGPIILAAAVLKLPVLAAPANRPLLGVSLIGALAAALAAYFSARFLSRYFKNNTLAPFAIYCIFAGLAAILLLG